MEKQECTLPLMYFEIPQQQDQTLGKMDDKCSHYQGKSLMVFDFLCTYPLDPA
jgi:hypothetical protein